MQWAIARLHYISGTCLLNRRGAAEALEHLKKAVTAYEQLARRRPIDLKVRFSWGMALYSLGTCLRLLRRLPESRERLREAKKLFEEAVAGDPNVTSYHCELARIHLNIGVTCLWEGKRKEALAAFDEAHDRFRELARKYPGMFEYRRGQADACELARAVWETLQQLDAALRAWSEASKILATAVSDFPNEVEFAQRLIFVRRKVTALRGDLCRGDGGRPMPPEDIALQRELMAMAPSDNPDIVKLAYYFAWLATVEGESGRIEESMRAIRERDDLASRDPGQLYGAACDFARVARRVTDLRRVYAEQAVATLRRAVANGFHDRARAQKEQAFDVLRDRGDFRKILDEMGPPAAAPARAPKPSL